MRKQTRELANDYEKAKKRIRKKGMQKMSDYWTFTAFPLVISYQPAEREKRK